MPLEEENILLILSSPSGAGKTTLSKKIQQKYQNFKISVSHTTRSPRDNEVDGVAYGVVEGTKVAASALRTLAMAVEMLWALALLLREDYRAVGIPMLPVVKGPEVTARAIRSYGWATVLMSGLGVLALPTGGLFYGVMVLPFNGRLLQMVHRLSLDPDSLIHAKGLFRWSILYLFGICLLLILSRLDLVADFDRQVMVLFAQLRAA